MNAIVRERLERSKETDLFYAVISFASRCLVEGDLTALRGVGFEPDDLPDIEGMSIADLQALSAARRSAVSVKLDRTAWAWHLKWVRHLRARERLGMALIRADAPKAMMAALLGMNDTEYARRREALGIRSYAEGGRPPAASRTAEQKLWDLWVRLARSENPRQLCADDFWIPFATEAGVTLRTAWNLLQRWAQDETLLPAFRRECGMLTPRERDEARGALRLRYGLPRGEEGDAASAVHEPSGAARTGARS
ncbi:MAG TPA: STY4526/YPO1902 family pathogenicity island replication protein [Nevskiaceae bacterium]|nr:STY4526/YPO1902 family pathogenicity island replication protein [Nevskiaceae bacterium]